MRSSHENRIRSAKRGLIGRRVTGGNRLELSILLGACYSFRPDKGGSALGLALKAKSLLHGDHESPRPNSWECEASYRCRPPFTLTPGGGLTVGIAEGIAFGLAMATRCGRSTSSRLDEWTNAVTVDLCECGDEQRMTAARIAGARRGFGVTGMWYVEWSPMRGV
jgi:hypothetical protein